MDTPIGKKAKVSAVDARALERQLAELSEVLSGEKPGQKTLVLALGGSVTMKLVRIEAGKFTMGSPKTETGRDDDEGPQHQVTITKPFYMGVHEVTQAQWRAVMGTEPWNGKDDAKPGDDNAASYIRFGGDKRELKADRPKQTVDNWGVFEPTMTQPSGRAATVGFCFRNGNRVHFEAYSIKVERLLADVKAYIKANPQNANREEAQIDNIGYRLMKGDGAKYVDRKVASWDLDIKPHAGHLDKRLTLSTPLQKAGAYLVTAKIEGGNRSSIVIWVVDAAAGKKPLGFSGVWYNDHRDGGHTSWDAATAFCTAMSKKTGRTVRLPTEAEWEYACRAGTTTAYSFGDDASKLGDYAWYAGNAGLKGEKYAQPVGMKKPNAWGLYDMHGNVWEWCADWYVPYPNAKLRTQKVPCFGTVRVLRGGANYDSPQCSRAASRHFDTPVKSGAFPYGYGFRVVVEAGRGAK